MPHKRKLIEVALPLEAINREAAREKSIRHGHPSTLHLWWARRPLAAARAVLFAQLVDDPSARPEEFPTEDDQRRERDRLHDLISRLVPWEATRDEAVLAEARAEILRSTDGNPPPILDPFAGGGTIPLEAKRLGFEATANDLNPLPVLINTVLLEMVDRFTTDHGISGGIASSPAEALALDLRHYAHDLERIVEKEVGALYPRTSDGSQPLVYFWARTVRCPNPACGVEIPLVGSWKASARKGSEAFFRPIYNGYDDAYDVEIVAGVSGEPSGTMARTGATCPSCDGLVPLGYVKSEGVAGRLGARMLALQVRAGRSRTFVPADGEQRKAASSAVAGETEFLRSSLSTHSQYMAPPRYGMTSFADLFSTRQLATLTAFVGGLDSIEDSVYSDAKTAGLLDDDVAYADGGTGARAYAEALRVLLALGIGRLVNRQSTLCIWNAPRQTVEQVFARQAYSMTWLYAEANPFAGASGSFSGQIDFLAKALAGIPAGRGRVRQGPAQELQPESGVVVSTDPPYYDNVPYADLADFFVVWHRRMLGRTLPLFPTVLSPKGEELVADHVRWGGKAAAYDYFESGFKEVFSRVAKAHHPAIPMTVYYAFRQSDAGADGRGSTGWETMLQALIDAGWTINGTWPMRTEQAGGLRSLGRNALASSVVVVCRRRDESAGRTDRRGLTAALKSELPNALRHLQQGQIAPVDLPQAAIGPGMAVFSRYAFVSEADGSPMTVRSALSRINQILDEVLSEQEGDFDEATRFAIAWYRQHGYGTGRFGDADNLARARNTSVDSLDREGMLTSRAGKVTLVKPELLDPQYDLGADDRLGAWKVLHHLIRVLDADGLGAAGEFLSAALANARARIEGDLVTELCHLLFNIAEKNGWTKDALAFNQLVTSWPDILDASRASGPSGAQSAFDFDTDGELS